MEGLNIGGNCAFQNGLGLTIKTVNSNSPWAYIREGLLSEGYLQDLGGLLSEFYGSLLITFIAASVWMYSISLFGSPISSPARCTVLTIPAVMVLLSCRGLPIATTHSPGRMADDEPRVRVGNFTF